MKNSTVLPRITSQEGRPHPRLYVGGTSEAAEQVAATEADVQLFWGEPLADVRERIERLEHFSKTLVARLKAPQVYLPPYPQHAGVADLRDILLTRRHFQNRPSTGKLR